MKLTLFSVFLAMTLGACSQVNDVMTNAEPMPAGAAVATDTSAANESAAAPMTVADNKSVAMDSMREPANLGAGSAGRGR